jgi:glycosyltransferase involved in cell wall biosynthesis
MFSYTNLFSTLAFSALILAALIQLFYYLRYYFAVALLKPSEILSEKPPVSIIICARNEAENLDNFLPAVLEQDYPDYEVIVVNDCSEDNTDDILGKYLLKYPHLKVSIISKDPKFTHNKKLAQLIGIKAAKNELLLFTDADCKPESNIWLVTMASRFTPNTVFVLGYGGYFQKKGLLNIYMRYDCMTIAMQYLGMAIRGLPYMGVGRNLAYKRSAFFENKDYRVYNQLISGDDDLFINSNVTADNTVVEFRRCSHTRSVSAATFKDFFKQKCRSMATVPYYKLRDKIALLIEPTSRILFYAALVVLLINRFIWPYVLACFGLRLCIQLITLILVSKKLNEKRIIIASLFFDIFSPIINTVFYICKPSKKIGVAKWR